MLPRPLSTLAATAAVVVATTGLAGCGGSEKTVSSIDITFKGDTVKPAGTKVKVAKGTKVTLHITADKAGEIHVHSSPEQHIDYQAGTSDESLTIDKPGVVDVESHSLDKLIVQLEVS